MKLLSAFFLMLTGHALAHPNGTYIIDNNPDVRVSIFTQSRCPKMAGSLTGGLKTLIFSEVAKKESYAFISSFYVETHVEDHEVYVQTDEECRPIEGGEEYLASKEIFSGYSLQRK